MASNHAFGFFDCISPSLNSTPSLPPVVGLNNSRDGDGVPSEAKRPGLEEGPESRLTTSTDRTAT